MHLTTQMPFPGIIEIVNHKHCTASPGAHNSKFCNYSAAMHTHPHIRACPELIPKEPLAQRGIEFLMCKVAKQQRTVEIFQSEGNTLYSDYLIHRPIKCNVTQQSRVLSCTGVHNCAAIVLGMPVRLQSHGRSGLHSATYVRIAGASSSMTVRT